MLAELTQKVSALVESKSAVGFNIKFDLGDDGIILVVGEQAPNRVTNEDGPAATTIVMSAANFAALMSGELSSMNAFMTGKLRVEGSMEKAMQLGSLFS